MLLGEYVFRYVIGTQRRQMRQIILRLTLNVLLRILRHFSFSSY
jgi:hypothetical protein